MLFSPRMKETVQREVTLLPGGGRARRGPVEWPLTALAILVSLALALVGWTVASSPRAALRKLPAERRAALLARTVGELRETCGEGRPGALRDHCRELASFAASFDECTGACVELVRRALAPEPTR